MRAKLFFSLACLACGSVAAHAGGPRWVSGAPFFSSAGQPIAWYTNHPLYFTDPGDLSSSVDHAAADALVANAAAVWNVPTASLVLAQGGSLDEHVTGAMLASGGSTPALPFDVQSANYQAKQIAVIYDTDGSVIDTLLGAGGSDPSGCLQTGVVESVDSFGTAGTIQHALLILNGRCTGSAPEKQLQLQYQLERAFGRVLGMGWSQTNDNVFTGSPTPSYNQALNWPVMHPIDVVCGLYTYQCMPQPFTLRADDLSGLTQLYGLPRGQAAGLPGKQDSLANASQMDGFVSFPNGQGMEGVNVTVRRRANYSPVVEDWQTISAVSGYAYRQQSGTPVSAQDGAALASIGTYDQVYEGYWRMARIPVPDADPWQTVVITTEPVNPLYTGPYALTTMAAGTMTIAPSGTTVQIESYITSRYYTWDRYQLTATDAVSDCNAASDGTEAAPATMAQTGWWTSVLCGHGHAAWTTMSIRANRSVTIEVTGLDETKSASAVKSMPMIGVWRSGDAMGLAPTLGVTPSVAFNSFGVSMTSLSLQTSAASSMRMVVVDQRGAGRPDFAYQARMLYADSIQPANVGATGGTVVISGTGFRPGNVVTVNGVAAKVTSVTSTTITAVAPSLRSLGTTRALLANVSVRDVTTNGMTTMNSALGYGSPQQRLQLVGAPVGTLIQDVPAATPFVVKVLASDGVTPLPNVAVTLFVVKGYATLGACGGVSCVVMTNTEGIAASSLTPKTAGAVTLRASTGVLSVSASFTVVAVPDAMTLVSAPAGSATVGAPAATAIIVQIMAGDKVTARAGETVTITVADAAGRLEACGAATCSLRTDAMGRVATLITPLASGTIRISVTSAAGVLYESFQAAAESMQVISMPSGSNPVGANAVTPFSVRVVASDGVTPVMGETVQFQVVSGSAVIGASGTSACSVMTDANGVASILVTPMAAGAITVTAVSPAGSSTATLIGTALPAFMQVVQLPAEQAIAGEVLTPGFSVRLLQADGKTPLSGQSVTFELVSGAGSLGACGGPLCSVRTDTNGVATTSVTVSSAGNLTMSAQAVGSLGDLVQTATVSVNARERSLVPSAPTIYVAEGVPATWTAQVAISDNLATTNAVDLTWTGSTQLSFAQDHSLVVGGMATMGVSLTSGLGAGANVQGTACAWGGVCGVIAAEGVSAAVWQLQVVSGSGQQIHAAGTPNPIVFRVVDGAGHPVIAASVAIGQALTLWQQECTDRGRCPASGVLKTAENRSVSDANGEIMLPPASILQAESEGPASAAVQITATAGIQANASVTLLRLP